MRAIFLDRDGTVIVEPPDERVDRPDKIKLYSTGLEALTLIASLDYEIFLITNQAGIAEGRINEEEFENLNAKVLELVEQSGAKVLKTYMCPHIDSDNCDCRKPKPKMILDAAQNFGIDLSQSWMIGDRLSDVSAGKSAGTKTILVQTTGIMDAPEANYVAADLLEAAKYIAKQEA